MSDRERITLTVLMERGGVEARASLEVPYEISTIIFGPWLDEAIRDLRAECRELIKLQGEKPKSTDF